MWFYKDFISNTNKPLSIREEYEKNTKKLCFNENIRQNTSTIFSCETNYYFMENMIVILKNDLKSKGYKNIDVYLTPRY